jgi:vWA-MoxR associated protein C-terminal domain/Trypsin-like peptidase domain
VIMSPGARLQNFTRECTVHVLSEDLGGRPIMGGSGFFVAPGVIVTCAHVVSRDGRAVSRVKVRWENVIYTGTAVARPPVKGDEAIWDPPDLCVITLDQKPARQPSVVLGALGYADRHELYIAGYNKLYNRADAQFQSKTTGVLGGDQELARGNVREIAGVEVAPGMSGGPVLDLRRGMVCGVTKAQRKPSDNLGGLFVPAEFIQREFSKEAWLPNQRASESNRRWHEQRDAVLNAADPASFGLDAYERRLLARCAAELRLAADDFTRLWGDITEQPPPRRFVSLPDLIADLADWTSCELNPMTKLFVWLACSDRITLGSMNKLLSQAHSRVEHQGQDRGRVAEYETKVRERQQAPRNPVLVVHLKPDSPAAIRTFKLDIWRYTDRDADPDPVVIDAGPYGLAAAKEAVMDTLEEQVRLPGGRQSVIEFALPDSLLNHPVEEWHITKRIPVGERYPVVVRIANRESDGISYLEQLRDRAKDFRNGAVPPHGSHEWDSLWLTCESRYTPKDLNRLLQRGRIPMVAMTAWHGRKRAVIRAVKEAGVAVIVWRHKQCTASVCTTLGGDGACPGWQFKEASAGHVAGERLTALPQKILAARLAQDDDGHGDQSLGIALLWDDPDLIPWVAGSPYRYPTQPAGWDDVEQLADLQGSGQSASGHQPAAPAAGVADL